MTNVQGFPPTPAQAHPPSRKRVDAPPSAKAGNSSQTLSALQGDSLSLTHQHPSETSHFGKRSGGKALGKRMNKGAGQVLGVVEGILERSYNNHWERVQSRELRPRPDKPFDGTHFHYDVYEPGRGYVHSWATTTPPKSKKR